jgi:AhpD family alkylhydroperoxidase
LGARIRPDAPTPTPGTSRAEHGMIRRNEMKQSTDYSLLAPEGMKAMLSLKRYVKESGLEPSLMHLVRVRVSQINGCAYCVDMHTKEARADGEDEQRLYATPVWRETPFFTPRERAALAWAEALTLVSQGELPEAVHADVREHFSEKEMVDLTLLVVEINGWNRVAIPFRAPVGSYQPVARAS